MGFELIDEQKNHGLDDQSDAERALVGYVMQYVNDWKDYRDRNFKEDWGRYFRLWRGVWAAEDKTTNTERSKLISPALQQAVEIQVSEQEEATFGRKNWFDLNDDVRDEDKSEMQVLRDLLLEDMEKANVPDSIMETYLNGALFGTLVSKIVVENVTDITLSPEGEAIPYSRVQVGVQPIAPDEFGIDPSALSIDEALGCAHDTVKPRHEVEAKKKAGFYRDVQLGSYTDDMDVSWRGEQKSLTTGDRTRLTEFHGLVPRTLLDKVHAQEDELLAEAMAERPDLFEDMNTKDEMYEDELVESIVTIANGRALLRAIENPFIRKDRSIIGCAHDRIPNRFWGRGVAEKTVNIQRTLDAELRARIDGMAMTIHPMMAVDGTRLPRGMRPTVGAGKTVITNGPPREVLMPMNFGQMSSQTFAQSSELERMIQMASGSMDTATSISGNARNNTASGMSMMQGTSVKRIKRVMRVISNHYLKPLVQKVAWRYMQFDNERYPIDDYDFVPRTTMGMMAREFEQAQLTNLLSMTPQGSPLFGLVLSQIVDNGSGEQKESFKEAIQQMMSPKEPSQEQQAAVMLELEKLKAEIEEIRSRAAMNMANAETRYGDSASKAFEAGTKRLKVEGDIEDNELDRLASITEDK